MLKLILMELYTQKKISFFIPVILLPLFLSLGDKISGTDMFPTLIFSLAVGFISYFMTSYSNSNTGETDKLQYKLLLSLPVSRTLLISAKYVMVCVWWLISYAWLMLVLLILKYVAHVPIAQPIFNWQVAFFSLCCCYFMNSIFYPLYYKYGFRVANVIGILVFFTLSNLAGKINSLPIPANFTALLFDYPLAAFATFTAVLILLTYTTTLYIFTKADY